MIREYFQTKPQEVNINNEKNELVIYPKIFKLETGRDLAATIITDAATVPDIR